MESLIDYPVREPDDDAHFCELERFVRAYGTRLDIDALLADIDEGRSRLRR